MHGNSVLARSDVDKTILYISTFLTGMAFASLIIFA